MNTKWVSMIWAMDKNGLIGKDNTLPWHSIEDRQFFKHYTINTSMLCGRKTYESWKPGILTTRELIIISKSIYKNPDNNYSPHKVTPSLEVAIQSSKYLPMIIGGRDLYKDGFKLANRLIVSIMHDIYDGNVFISNDIQNFILMGAPGWERTFFSHGQDADYYIYEKPHYFK